MDLKRISAAEAKELIEKQGYTLVDVRSIPEYVQEHAAGALNLPYLHKAPYGMIPNQDFTRAVQALFPDPNAKLIMSCQMGARSLRAAIELINTGYKDVIDMRGGFGGERDDNGAVVAPGWKDSGFPTETGDTPGKGYADLSVKAGVGARTTAAQQAQAHSHGGPSHAAHSHAGHSHAEGEACGAPAPPPVKKMSRFADPSGATVFCNKFGRELPALKRKPFANALGERIKKEISADAWELWVEHSKMLINEYRLSPMDPRAQEMLMQQCEAFLFGEGARLPEGYVPQAASK